MNRQIRFALLSISLLSLVCSCAGYQNYAAKIEVNADDSSYNLTSSASTFVLTLPKNSLLPMKPLGRGPTQNPRYFHFRDNSAKLNVSGWFEPHYLYPGQEKYFDRMAENLRNNGLPMPGNVKHFRHSLWRVTSYEMPCGSSYTPDLHAHFHENDTWIDLHLSYDCGSGKEHGDLMDFLSTIRVVSK